MSQPTRIVAVDVLRGLTVAGMLLVNDPGDPNHVFGLLRHSDWNGCTLADFVFPFFLFLVGITTHLSLRRRETNGDAASAVFAGVCKRGAIIFLLGLALNAYPFFEKSAVAGPDWLPTFVQHIAARLEMLRITGVLQRIGVAYVVAALLVWKATARRVAVTAAVLLLGYWALMTVVPVPGEGVTGAAVLNDPARTIAAWFDRVALDWTRWGLGWHLWDRNIPYDPEGIFSTIPSIATVLLGVLAGRWLSADVPLEKRFNTFAVAGTAGLLAGLLWAFAFPINKPLWSSSYVVFTAGAACVCLAIIGWMVDVRQRRGWITPWLVFGTNPIVAYVGGELLASILRSSIKFKIDGVRLSTGMTVVRRLEGLGIESRVASLVWALLFVALCYAMLRPMYRRGIFLRV
ncbi:MAG: acyltransferase family protein [Gemmatimonas sp.]